METAQFVGVTYLLGSKYVYIGECLGENTVTYTKNWTRNDPYLVYRPEDLTRLPLLTMFYSPGGGGLLK